METKNEQIYRQVLEKIILEMQYGDHYSLRQFETKIAEILNDAPLVIVDNLQTRAIGVTVSEQ